MMMMMSNRTIGDEIPKKAIIGAVMKSNIMISPTLLRLFLRIG